MNRRTFLVTSSAAFVFSALGCNTTTVAAFVSLIANYAAQLATYFGSTGTAAQITALAGQIATDIQNWQNGSSAQDAIQAINDLMDLISLIPVATPYLTLIDLLLSALSGLLLLLPASATANIKPKVQRRAIAPFHYGGFDKKSMTEAKNNFVSQWKADSANLTLSRQ